jgi:hypothetical protein
MEMAEVDCLPRFFYGVLIAFMKLWLLLRILGFKANLQA